MAAVMEELHGILSDAALTNLLLAGNIVVVTKMFMPTARALTARVAELLAQLAPTETRKRAQTEPGVQ